MTLILNNIPPELDTALQVRAKAEGKSVDQVAVETMKAGLGMGTEPQNMRDLSDLAGTWVEDPEFDAIMKEQDQVDPEIWK